MGEKQEAKGTAVAMIVREAPRMRLRPSLRWERGAADVGESPEAHLRHMVGVWVVGLLGLEPQRVDWGTMKKLGGIKAGVKAVTVGTVAQEGCKDEKRDQTRPWYGQGDPSFLPFRVCSVRSVDGSPTTAFTVLECEGSRRLGSRPRRYLLTGQANGSLAMWDLTTAMDGLGQAPGTSQPTSILSQAPQTLPELTHNLLQQDLPPQALAL